MTTVLAVLSAAVTVLYALSALARLVPVKRRHYRWGQFGGMLASTLLVVGLASCAYVAVRGATAPRDTAEARAPVALRHDVLPTGVFAPGEWDSWSPVKRFGQETGRPVHYVLDYMGPDEAFPARLGALAAAHHAEPVLQMEPTMSMAGIAAGHDDSYLRDLSRQVSGYGHPLVLSFAPEANGNWYSWGWSHTPAAQWVAAWRHVVTVFRQQHVRNVTWMWTVNVPFPASGPVSDYWPGAAYVGMIGIDGYFVHSSDTFNSVFGPIVDQIRSLTAKPLLISETAVGPDSGTEAGSQVRSLFAGAKAGHLAGLIWFDQAQHGSAYHQDWRLEDNPAALAAFRAAAKEHGQ
ncbi:MAG: hypothetical protein FWE35_00075 [Streptosporangiales bacterium]|nr:hypothetical protein [Streptosporangiales bacterium]